MSRRRQAGIKPLRVPGQRLPNELRGLLPETFSPTQRWKVDQDYIHQLSDEERLWLAQFNDAEYWNRFYTPVGELYSLEQKREVYNNNNATRRDIYARADNFNRLAEIDGDSAKPPSASWMRGNRDGDEMKGIPLVSSTPTPEQNLQFKQTEKRNGDKEARDEVSNAGRVRIRRRRKKC